MITHGSRGRQATTVRMKTPFHDQAGYKSIFSQKTERIHYFLCTLLEGIDCWGWGGLPPQANRNSATGKPRQRCVEGGQGTTGPCLYRF